MERSAVAVRWVIAFTLVGFLVACGDEADQESLANEQTSTAPDNGAVDDNENGDGVAEEDGDGVALADPCEVLSVEEIDAFARRSVEGTPNMQVIEVETGRSTMQDYGGGRGRAECEWTVIEGLVDPGATVVFPDAQCNDDWTRCERTFKLSFQLSDFAGDLEGPDGIATQDGLPGYEGRSTVAATQGSVSQALDDGLELTAFVTLHGAPAEGAPEVVSDVLATTAERLFSSI